MIIAVNFSTQASGKKQPEKHQGFNGIRTRASAIPVRCSVHQLSYEATHWERGQFNDELYTVYEIIHTLLSSTTAVQYMNYFL